MKIAALIATSVIVFASPTFGQQAQSATEKPEFRKWDVGGSLGIIGSPTNFSGRQQPRYTEVGSIWNIDAGRYFTPHLKVEAGLMGTNARSFYERRDDLTYSYGRVKPTSVSAAVSYQFFENVFAHPYVSAGIRVTSFHEESETAVYTPGLWTATVSPGSRRFAQARPFVAAGYKSYFNERLYMRSDLLIALDETGFSHGTLRVGFGIDF